MTQKMSIKNFVFLFWMYKLSFNEAYSQFLYDGEHVSSEEFAWEVKIFDNGKYICAGSIIAKNLITTANHCVYDNSKSNLTVQVRNVDIQEGMSYKVLGVINHPNFSGDYQNDLALLQTANLYESNGTRSISLPSNDFEDPGKGDFPHWRWGCRYHRTDCKHVELWKSTLTVISPEECRGKYDNFSNANINDEKICAGHVGGRQGESGGGLVVYTEGGTPILFGILSFSSCSYPYNHDDCSRPRVFTRVYSDIEFFHKHVNGSSRIQHKQLLCNFILIFYIIVNCMQF